MAMNYSAKVMDHFTNPRNVGEIADANAVGEVGNPTCGDIMRIYMKIENNVITDVKFKTFGCGAAVGPPWVGPPLGQGKPRCAGRARAHPPRGAGRARPLL